MKMKAFNTKLVLSALAVALIATPALAERPHHQASHPLLQGPSANVESGYVGTYPNGASRSGSAYSVESGAEFNLIR
jgi:hypothetical protein